VIVWISNDSEAGLKLISVKIGLIIEIASFILPAVQICGITENPDRALAERVEPVIKHFAF
jgi:hypothetical protein